MTRTQEQPKPDWAPVPRPGCANVDFRVLLNADGILIANLRFMEKATIDEHTAPHDIDVLCIAGSGFTSVGEEELSIKSGENIRWPKGLPHRLWTEDSTMETIMVERYGA